MDGTCDTLGVYGKARRDGWIRRKCLRGHVKTSGQKDCQECHGRQQLARYYRMQLDRYWQLIGLH